MAVLVTLIAVKEQLVVGKDSGAPFGVREALI